MEYSVTSAEASCGRKVNDLKLIQLEPFFCRYETRVDTWQVVDGDPSTWRERGCPTHDVTGPKEYVVRVESLSEAQGVEFLCPKCFQENKGPVGTHYCMVTFQGRGVPDEQGSHTAEGRPVRWVVTGTSLEDLTMTPSILLVGGCNWHGFITNGNVT